jgi:hypothetical protein
MRTESPLLRNLRHMTPLFLRPALGVTFLSAVTDRFGFRRRACGSGVSGTTGRSTTFFSLRGWI